MKNQIFYLPIKSANIAHYFRKGIVCPTFYLQNRINDIQNKFENQLLFSNIKYTDETNCALEIVLDDRIEKVDQISENFYLCNFPLPISRIKKIIFQEEKQKIQTIFDITNGAAFLPDSLIEIDSNFEKANTDQLRDIYPDILKENWKIKIEKFDRLLGGFALMSIAGNEFQNYPSNYFNTLSVINSLIKQELVNQSIEESINYDWAILNTGTQVSLHDVIYSKIINYVVEDFAKKEGIKLEKNNGKYLIDKIDENKYTYLVAILASYGGEGARMTIDTFISDFLSNKFPDKRKEGLALIFGINKGYEILRNKYKTQNFDIDIKFKLESQLDYYIIESIYQYVFYNNKDNTNFHYIDNWCIRNNEEINIKGFETYKILDKTIIYKKKEAFFQDFFQDLFQSTSRNKIYEKIVYEINKCIPSYIIDKENITGLKYFKNLLEEDFKEYSKSFYDKLKENFENDLNKSKQIEDLNNKIKSKNKEINELKEKLYIFSNIKEKDKKTENKYDNKKHISRVSEPNIITNETSLIPELFDSESSEESIKLIKRTKELKQMGITKLKELANSIGINEYKTYKNNVNDIEKLSNRIIEIEFPNK